MDMDGRGMGGGNFAGVKLFYWINGILNYWIMKIEVRLDGIRCRREFSATELDFGVPATPGDGVFDRISLDGSGGSGSGGSATGGSGSGSAGSGSGSGSGSGIVWPRIAAGFELAEEVPAGYSDGRYEGPTAEVVFGFDAAERPTVVQLIEGGAAATMPVPSAQLLKEMTTAVTATLSAYFTAAGQAAKFTAPFRIGLAYRLKDGSRVLANDPTTLFPVTSGPEVVIRESQILGASATTHCQITNHPSAVRITIPPVSLNAESLAKLAALDIYISRQVDLYDAKTTVTGIGSTTMADGSRARAFRFAVNSDAYIAAQAAGFSDFRVAASLPVATVTAGCEGIDAQIPATATANWKSLPELTFDPPKGGDYGGEIMVDGPEAEFLPWFRMETEPLDLGRDGSRVRGVTLHGIFPRGEVRMRLYGSHHRERWRELATSRGEVMRRLRGVRYKWWKVVIIGRIDRWSELEYLEFEVS